MPLPTSEAIKRAGEALALHVEGMLADGKIIPEPAGLSPILRPGARAGAIAGQHDGVTGLAVARRRSRHRLCFRGHAAGPPPGGRPVRFPRTAKTMQLPQPNRATRRRIRVLELQLRKPALDLSDMVHEGALE
jgi:hypothetical protein